MSDEVAEQSPVDDNSEVIEAVVAEIRPEISQLREDILSDVKELLTNTLSGQQQQQPPPQAPDQISGIMSTLGNSMPNQGVDYTKLTPDQHKWMREDKLMALATAVLPILVQNSQTNPLFTEMINRMFVEQFSNTQFVMKSIINRMAGDLGAMQQIKQDSDALTQNTVGPIYAAAKASMEQQRQQAAAQQAAAEAAQRAAMQQEQVGAPPG